MSSSSSSSSSTDQSVLFTPLKVGEIEVRNRIFMAPLTRGRADLQTSVPKVDLVSTYYTQRATAGLIISEATAISPQGRGWLGAPAIYSDAQRDAWSKIVSGVHKANGKMVLQLWHMGRVSHSSFHEGGALPVAPSAIAAKGSSHTPAGKQPYQVPRALETSEIPGLVESYAFAARQAKLAGFDGVEIHGANGYLIDQFLRDGTNKRTDQYGGSVENRARLLLEVVDATVREFGVGRVGVRVSPVLTYNDMQDSDPVALFSYVAQKLQERNIAYLHVAEGLRGSWLYNASTPVVHPTIRQKFKNTLIINGGYSASSAADAIQSGTADAVAFGASFLANPDLVRRIEVGAPWNTPKMATFYTFDAEGYIDYPTLQ